MRFSVLFLSLAAPAFSAVIQQIITCDSGSGNGELGHFPEDVIRPQWESRNGLTLVPLNRTARSGLLDPIREEGLITGLGPRFANQFISNVTDKGDLVGCGWMCATTLIKELPCVYKAIKDRKPSELLDCGVNKKDICACDTCLPSLVQKYVTQWCDSAEAGEPTSKTSYADFNLVGQSDLNIAAFRGDLKTYQISEVRAADFCPGTSCGGCNCCIGGCVFGQCLGVCTTI